MREGYKESEFGWIPIDWDIKRLSDIAKCTVGIASSATHAYSDNGILLLRNQNIKEGKLDLDDVLYVTSEYEVQHKTKRLKAGDILSIRTGYPGISAVVPKELEGAQSFTTLITRLFDECVTSKFLCYFINSKEGKSFFNSSQAGGGQKNVGSKTLESMKIPIPSISEQQKIVEILSTVDDKIDVIDQQISETQALKKGLMQRLLTKGIGHTEFKDSPLGEIPKSWEVYKLNEVADIASGGTPSRSNPNYWNGNIPWVTTSLIRFNYISNSEELITELAVKNSSARLFPKGTILMAMYGQGVTRGKVAVLDIEATTNQACSAIISNPKLYNIFLFYCLMHRYEELRTLSNAGSQENLSGTIIKNLNIQIPSLFEQKKIANILSSVDEKLEVLSNKKTHYQELKQGLMQQLLTGKIRVKIKEAL